MTNEELFRRLNAGDETVRDEIIVRNRPLVTHTVMQKNIYVADPSCDMDDMISIGMIGLIKAVEGFDVEKGTQFSTYAVNCITNELRMAQRYMGRRKAVLSLDSRIDGEEARAYINLMADNEVPMEKRVADRDVLRKAAAEIRKLDPRERRVMVMHLKGLGTLRQTDIAKSLGFTQSYCSRLITKAQRQLREVCEYE